MTPSLTLDQAINQATAAEATYNADLANVNNIEGNIATATAPLPAAQATLATDTEAYVNALNVVSEVALATAASLAPASPPAS